MTHTIRPKYFVQNSAENYAISGTGHNWLNPQNAVGLPDNNVAQADVFVFDGSRQITLTIPRTGLVPRHGSLDGIRATVRRASISDMTWWINLTAGGVHTTHSDIYLLGTGGELDEMLVLGSPTSTLGLSASNVNAGDIGARIRALVAEVLTTAYIDSITVEVWYSARSSPTRPDRINKRTTRT